MCGPDAIVKDIYAFLPLAGKETLGEKGKEVEGEKGNVGLIAAVGVDKKARGRGVGLALVGRAMEVRFLLSLSSYFWFMVSGFRVSAGTVELERCMLKVP